VVESDVNLDDVKVTGGDFNQKQLAAAVNNARRNELALAAWQEHAEGLSTLAFTVDVPHAHAVAKTFCEAGYQAAAISGETPKEERRSILRAYTDGRIQLVANCMVLTEGTDLPRTRCVLNLKPTKSGTLYEQMIGRGLRLFEGKEECIVIDVADVAKKHSLQVAPTLYGLPPGLVAEGKRLDEMEAALEKFKEEFPTIDVEALLKAGRLTLAQLQAKASTFDVWKVPDLGSFREVVTLNWIRGSGDSFTLSYPWQDGQEKLAVQANMLGKYEVVATFRQAIEEHGRYVRTDTRQRTLATDLPGPVEALKLAEHFVMQERGSVSRLRANDAPWRSRPASTKQLDLLRKWRVPIPKTCTSGQASDLIDLARSRRR
jgi:Helicase conserved C-terminal domain